MGRGPRTEPEKKIAAPIDLLDKVDIGEAGGSASDGASFCAREHLVPFVLAEGASAQAGEQVRLVQAHPPAVRAAGRLIGEISESDALAMASCMRMGYRMTGTIESIESSAGSGVLRISGEPREPV